MATGWMGWAPTQAWEATVTEILLAWEAKVHFLKMTNPNPAPAPAKPPDKAVLAKDLRVGLRAAAMNRKQG